MVFINETGTIGLILSAGTAGLTGNIVISLLIIMLFLITIAMLFSIPLEYTAIIILPLCISCGAYYNTFLAPTIVILIYLATIITKNWLFK